MKGRKKYWENQYEHIRIKEILDAYWLEEPDELLVHVKMYFQKANGETQEKTISWINPNYECADTTEENLGLSEITLGELLEMGFSEKELPYVDVNKYRKKEEIT